LVDGQLNEIGTLSAMGRASIRSSSLDVGSHTVTALYNGDRQNAPSLSQPIKLRVLPVSGDLDGDGIVNCTDLAIVEDSFLKRVGQAGFDPRADINGDGVKHLSVPQENAFASVTHRLM